MKIKKELKLRYLEAVRLKKDGDLTAAKKILLELSKEDANSPVIFVVLGDVCWELKLLDKAIIAFKKAVRLKPKWEVASKGLFHCYWELGNVKAALREMKRFLSVSYSEDYCEIINEMHEKWVTK